MSALVVAVGLVGCSGSSGSSQATPSTSQGSAATTSGPSASVDAHATAAIARAADVMRRMQAYHFAADEEVVAATRLHTHLAGSLVRGQGITYRLTAGGKTTQVVRLRSATYFRVVPHHWLRLKHPRRLVDPTATLLRLLSGLHPTGAATSNGITAVHGTLSPAAARAAGLPATRPADVTVTIDSKDRVIAVDLRTTTRAAGRDVTVRLRASYDGFGQVAPIHPPA